MSKLNGVVTGFPFGAERIQPRGQGGRLVGGGRRNRDSSRKMSEQAKISDHPCRYRSRDLLDERVRVLQVRISKYAFELALLILPADAQSLIRRHRLKLPDGRTEA